MIELAMMYHAGSQIGFSASLSNERIEERRYKPAVLHIFEDLEQTFRLSHGFVVHIHLG